MFDVENMLLYQDAALLVVNKPAGLPTLPDGYDRQAPCLVDLLKGAFDALWTVHRLDKDTSGVIVFARNAAAHRALNTQFEQRRASKVYVALCQGVPTWDNLTVALPLRPNGDRKHRTVVDSQRGKASTTDLCVLERFNGYTLIQAMPRTGRTHQIRVHLAVEGCPIVADALYGLRPTPSSTPSGALGETQFRTQPGDAPSIARLALHACSLTLVHPDTNQELRFEAPYPEDFVQALQALRGA